jgi:hypothetical protein
MILRTLRPALVLLGVILVTPLAAAPPGGPSSSFRVTGDVTKRTSFDLEALEALPVTKENVTYFAAGVVVTQSFTGTLLWDLLQSVGIVVDPKIKNDILRKVIIVTGSDGYEAAFGAGEIAPTFGGVQIMVAYAVDGQALDKDGFARIVAPGDKAGGRFVSNIVKIEVQDAGK